MVHEPRATKKSQLNQARYKQLVKRVSSTTHAASLDQPRETLQARFNRTRRYESKKIESLDQGLSQESFGRGLTRL